MKIAIYSSGYPSEGDKYNYCFVHARAKLYVNQGHEVKVFRNLKNVGISYLYENIEVIAGENAYILDKIDLFKPDVFCVHSPEYFFHVKDMFALIRQINTIPMIIWIHGFEALSFVKYYKADIYSLASFFKYCYNLLNHYFQLKKIKQFLKFIENSPQKNKIVFVSEWQKTETSRTLKLKFRNFEIIPNPIDEKLFVYKVKKPEDRFQMLTIRPLNSNKYAVDITLSAIKKLCRGTLDVYGEGFLIEKFRRLSKRATIQVSFVEKFIDHSDMPLVHEKYGLYLSPSRTDSQGVAMCEAMSSGLPVLTSRVGGIPEFVEDEISGFLCRDKNELNEKIKYIQENPSFYLEMSRNAAISIRKICGSSVVSGREIEMMKKLTGKG